MFASEARWNECRTIGGLFAPLPVSVGIAWVSLACGGHAEKEPRKGTETPFGRSVIRIPSAAARHQSTSSQLGSHTSPKPCDQSEGDDSIVSSRLSVPTLGNLMIPPADIPREWVIGCRSGRVRRAAHASCLGHGSGRNASFRPSICLTQASDVFFRRPRPSHRKNPRV